MPEGPLSHCGAGNVSRMDRTANLLSKPTFYGAVQVAPGPRYEAVPGFHPSSVHFHL